MDKVMKARRRPITDSVTRLGNFLKCLATKFLAKEAEMIGNFLGNFQQLNSYVKTASPTFS